MSCTLVAIFSKTTIGLAQFLPPACKSRRQAKHLITREDWRFCIYGKMCKTCTDRRKITHYLAVDTGLFICIRALYKFGKSSVGTVADDAKCVPV